jgi:hypothetical protein
VLINDFQSQSYFIKWNCISGHQEGMSVKQNKANIEQSPLTMEEGHGWSFPSIAE